MMNLGIIGKHDSVIVLIFCRLSEKERVRLLYEHETLDNIPLSALVKSDPQPTRTL